MRHKLVRSKVVLAAVMLLVGLVAGNAGAANPFTDIAGNTHADNIDAIYNAGITAGCSTGPTFYCPNDNVTRAQMASFLARGLALSGGTTKNFPKANGKSDAAVYCALATANPSSFDRGPCRATTLSVDSAFTNHGQYTAMAFGVDGTPWIAHRNATDKVLRLVRCTTPTCTSFTADIMDTDNDSGLMSSMAIGVNGGPLVAYYDPTNGVLFVASCNDAECHFPNPALVDDGGAADAVGAWPSIGVRPDGIPVISYHDVTDGDLLVAICADDRCNGAASVVALDTTGVVGNVSSLAIDPLGRPVIAYFDDTNDNLKLARCANADCTGAPKLVTVDAVGSVGMWPAITIGADGFPVIAYQDIPNKDVKVAKCTDAACDAATITTIDSTGGVGERISIEIGLDGNPVVAYRDETRGGVRVARCVNRNCTGTPSFVNIDAGRTILFPSMAIGLDGTPIVSYHVTDVTALYVARAELT